MAARAIPDGPDQEPAHLLRRLPALLLLLGLFLLPEGALAGGGPSETVVLVNTESEDSARVAEAYAAARQIPPTHLLRVACETGLSTEAGRFVSEVVDPLRSLLRERGLADRCHFIVLTQGMPIRARTKGGGWVSTTALLGLLDTPVAGRMQPRGQRADLHLNPYRGGPAPDGAVLGGRRFYLATALVSSTAEEALSLILRSTSSDDTAPRNARFLFQDALGAAGVRNGGYAGARSRLEAIGFRTAHGQVGPAELKDIGEVMGYMSGGSYSKLTPQGVATIEYLPGAICDMLQSFGAVPENFVPDGMGRQFPVTHMIRAGITGVHGAVAEPYNNSFPTVDLFEPYVSGFTLAESFHSKMPFVYWMNLVIGDPLCAPYADRPDVEVKLDGRPVGEGVELVGTTTLSVEAATRKGRNIARITLYVDGVEIAAVEDAATFAPVLDTDAFPAGAHHLLVEAVARDPARSHGWWATTIETRARELRALRPLPARLPADGGLIVELNREPRAGEDCDLQVLVDARSAGGGRAVEGRLRRDGRRLVFEPAGPVTGAVLAARLTVHAGAAPGTPVRWDLSPAAGSLDLQVPETVTAGEEFRAEVRPLTPSGAALEGWRGRIEVRTEEPPVRWAATDVTGDRAGPVEVPLRFTTARSLVLRATAPDDGLAATGTVRIVPAAPHHVTTPLSKVPLLQPVDVPLVMQDEFGNPVTDWTGTLRLRVEDDDDALLPTEIAVTEASGGRVTLRDVRFTRPGAHGLEIRDGEGRTWSLPTEGVTAEGAGIRAWLAGGCLPEDVAGEAFSGDPAAGADRVDAVAAGLLLSRLRSSQDEIRLPTTGAGATGGAALAVTFLQVAGAVPVRFAAAGPSRIRVVLDGQEIFDGTPEEKNPRGKRKKIGEAGLTPGLHVLSVAVERPGEAAPSFALGVVDEKGGHPAGVVVLGTSPEPIETVTISGTVTDREGRPAAGVDVTVKVGRGKRRKVETDARGFWHLSGLSPGKVGITASGARVKAEPSAREITLEDVHLSGLDFRLK